MNSTTINNHESWPLGRHRVTLGNELGEVSCWLLIAMIVDSTNRKKGCPPVVPSETNTA